jgi:hypothetical protein
MEKIWNSIFLIHLFAKNLRIWYLAHLSCVNNSNNLHNSLSKGILLRWRYIWKAYKWKEQNLQKSESSKKYSDKKIFFVEDQWLQKEFEEKMADNSPRQFPISHFFILSLVELQERNQSVFSWKLKCNEMIKRFKILSWLSERL